MKEIDVRYKKLIQICDQYAEKERQLRYQIYGYYKSMDIIVPYNEPYDNVSEKNTFIGFERFKNIITNYFDGFSEETGSCFTVIQSDIDKDYAKAMLGAIFYYIKEECNENDYTFMSIVKLLKTFLEPLEDVSEEINKENNVFWILYTDIIDKVRKNYPLEIQENFHTLFQNYNERYACNIADCLYYALRFFLYDYKLDYTSDSIMMHIVSEMSDEISERLHNIDINRRPRKRRTNRW